MKRRDTNIEAHLGLFRSPPVQQMAGAEERALDRLRTAAAGRMDVLKEEPRSIGFHWRWRLALVGAAAAVGVAVMEAPDIRRVMTGATAAAVVETAGGLYRASGRASGRVSGQVVHAREQVDVAEVLRTNGGAGAMLALADGSRVEMRSQSELSLERADDGMRIRLRSGSIIVNAAKQPSGHLYVQTKDMTVSVVGTIFLVNAETDGSRVAVIEGEVRVHEGTTETKLHSGEQVSSSPKLESRPVKEEIAWSRQADAHLAILAAFEKGMAATAGSRAPLANTSGTVQAPPNQTSIAAARQEFEEASIRPCDPDNLPQAPEGARGGGANSLQMTPGRTHVLCMTLATIIRESYGYAPADINPGGRGRGLNRLNTVYGLGVEDGRRVRGGPDWVRSERYTIEAVADGASDAATMSGPMLQALLERRFQLKTHIETEQVPAFNLTVAKGGLKITPVSADGVQPDGFIRVGVNSEACESLPPPPPGEPAILRPRTADEVRRGAKPYCGLFGSLHGPNQVFVAGGTTFGALARTLRSPLGGVQVLDKTGSADKFNFVLEYVIDENTPGPLDRFLQQAAPEPAGVPRGQTIFAALEEQLGLKLEPARAPREFIVIDRVERPSPN
jgi:uncharacterized protein (TIGR03435 family)